MAAGSSPTVRPVASPTPSAGRPHAEGLRVIAPILDGPTDRRTVRERLSLALERAADGRLHPAIGATYSLDRAADAHRALDARTTEESILLTPTTAKR